MSAHYLDPARLVTSRTLASTSLRKETALLSQSCALTSPLCLSPQLTTLRGAILEDAIPSTARHGTARGLPLREVLEYLVPELSTQCLRQAPSSPRVAEQLLRLDEQGVCTTPARPSSFLSRPSGFSALTPFLPGFSQTCLRASQEARCLSPGTHPLCCDLCRFTEVRAHPSQKNAADSADRASVAFLPGCKTLTLSLSVN